MHTRGAGGTTWGLVWQLSSPCVGDVSVVFVSCIGTRV